MSLVNNLPRGLHLVASGPKNDAINYTHGKVMPRQGINDADRLLSKVELFPRRNSAIFLVSDCLSKVELFLRRNITVLLLGDPVVEGRSISP